jgi:DNA polymerase III subunit delta'
MSQGEISVFELLKGAHQRQHLGHALLLIAPQSKAPKFRKGLLNFVQYLMCTYQQELEACHQCDSCKAFAAVQEHDSHHPDLFWLTPQNTKGYAVDQIKELRSQLSLSKSLADQRVILIEEAETLGAGGGAAANALLKILEEPRPDTKLLLLSHRPEGLLPTLRSRCQLFRIALTEDSSQTPLSDSEQLQEWQPLLKWIQSGASLQHWPQLMLPADSDSFFKEREAALEELQAVFEASWRCGLDVIPHLTDEQNKGFLSWMHDFEQLIYALKGQGQAGLQWFSFKTRARTVLS